MPLFNTVRVLLTGGVGRPGLKFLRGLLDTGDIADNSTDILATVVAAVEAATLTLLGEIVTAGCEVLEGAAGRPVTSASTQLTVQMRQEHRKRKRSV
jgi:hypothetical protein